jgi:hypothetical protein
MDQDKRKYPRIAGNIKLHYTKADSGVVSFAKDVSAGGISFAADETLQEGTSLRLVFVVEGVKEEITATGKVVRSWQDKGMLYVAVEFVETEDNMNKLHEWIEEHEKH